MLEFIKLIEYYITWLGPNRYIQAGFIIIVSIIIAKIGELLITRVAVKFTRRTKTNLDDHLIAISHRPLFISFILIGLAMATLRVELPKSLAFFIMAILKNIGVVVWLVFAIKFTKLFISFMSRKPDKFKFIQTSTRPLLINLANVVFIGSAIYFILLSWHINVSAWLASAGIIGIALGFAAKDTLANLFAGMFILVDAPYKIGDFIVLDSGERGEVTHIGIRSTRMLTRDDVEITIPNSVMGNSKIINESGGPHAKERVRVGISVAYGSDIDKVRELLMDIALAHPNACQEPEPRVRFRSFGDSGLNFELLVWIDEPVLRGRALDALNCEVYKKFQNENIQIPFPQMDLYIKESPQK